MSCSIALSCRIANRHHKAVPRCFTAAVFTRRSTGLSRWHVVISGLVFINQRRLQSTATHWYCAATAPNQSASHCQILRSTACPPGLSSSAVGIMSPSTSVVELIWRRNTYQVAVHRLDVFVPASCVVYQLPVDIYLILRDIAHLN